MEKRNKKAHKIYWKYNHVGFRKKHNLSGPVGFFAVGLFGIFSRELN